MAIAATDAPVALVSGSAMGIGRALCTMLTARGMHVVGLDLDAEANAETASTCAGAMVPITCDVGDAAGVKAAVDAVVARTGRIDLVVNNSAIFNDTTLLGGDYERQVSAWHRCLDAILHGAFHLTAAAAPTMVAAGRGDVVNLITDHIRPGYFITGMIATGYDAGKFGLWRLTESWADELGRHGVRVNGLAFGATDTPMLRGVSPRMAPTAMRPEQVADAVCAIVDQGDDGPTGAVYDFGFTGTPHDEVELQIAAIRATRRADG
jgi:NAD(P)-dependent dehydrogenase (short-subunit alcohol dehydrogenase family)